MTNFGWSYPPGCSGPPDDNYDDTICIFCGADLPMDWAPEDDPDLIWEEGFCSESCKIDHINNEPFPNHPRLSEKQEKILDSLSIKAYKSFQKALKNDTEQNWTISSLFKYAPKGDFEWKQEEAGDWHIYCCGEKDCPTQWHLTSYTEDIGRRNGKQFIDLHSCDEDGNWDFDIGWEEGEDPSYIMTEIMQKLTQYFYGWAKYWIDCAYCSTDHRNQLNKTNPTFDDFIECITENIKFIKRSHNE